MAKLKIENKLTYKKNRQLLSLDPILLSQAKDHCLNNNISLSYYIETLIFNHLELLNK